MNISMLWPVALVVFSNLFYQVSAKGTPENINPLASLTVTYLVGAAFSAVLYCLTTRGGNLLSELCKLNWAPFVLGLCVVGLEAGCIYMYKVGWDVSIAHTVHSTILAIALIFLGFFAYHEPITPNKLIGLVFTMIGLFFINR